MEKWGYKLVILLNITSGCERIVGFSLAPLQTSEKTMLREILEHLNKEIAPLKKWMDILVMNRGYWGAEYLTELKKDFGIDYVTRARDEGLEVVEYILCFSIRLQLSIYQGQCKSLLTIINFYGMIIGVRG